MEPSPEVLKYIEDKILPQYGGIGGHTDAHIRQVMERSLHFAKQAPGVNIDMVILIAAFHDLGRLVDQKTHNIESGKMVRKDKFLKTYFSAEEIEIMAEAVEDHRASLGHEPRNIYGKIVSSADRNTDIKTAMGRVYDYCGHLYPDMSDLDLCEESRVRLREKYSPDGYAAGTMYFEDPNFAGFLVGIEEITRDPETFVARMHELNEERGIAN